jgi:Skp family chaperone for outer membrane proteins
MMTARLFLSALLSVGAMSTASAQTPAAPASPGLGGPVVAGVCLLSREAIFANAAAGKAATARLQQLTSEAQAEVEADRRPIDADIKVFQAEQAKLSPEQKAGREKALAARLAPIQAKAQQRGREIEATRAKALERISAEAQPVIAQVYKAKACGLLVDRNSVLGGNLANDLTPAVVQGLDARLPTLTFDRETLPAPPPAAAAR